MTESDNSEIGNGTYNYNTGNYSNNGNNNTGNYSNAGSTTGVDDGNTREIPTDPPTIENTNIPTNVGPTYKNMCNIHKIEIEEHHEQDEELHNQYIQDITQASR